MAKRLRRENFPIPNKIGNANWVELCETFHIPSECRGTLRVRLNELVDALAIWMSSDRTLPDRKSDREKVKEILSCIKAAAAQTAKLGPAGHLASKAISPFAAPMLAAQWMNESFLDDDDTPRRSAQEDSSGLRPPRDSIRAPTYFIEELSHQARFEFVHKRPVETIVAALQQIAAGLGEVLRAFDLQPSSRGGQEPLLYRHYAIIHLIEIWNEIGKEPSSGPTSACTAFCESVVVAMGWPTEGLSSAMPDAVKHWRHLSGKSKR